MEMTQVGETLKQPERLKEILAGLVGAEDEPCRFSPAESPHPVIETENYYCDGYGYVFRREDGALCGTRCKCQRKWARKSRLTRYLNQLHPHTAGIVDNAEPKRGALRTVVECWNFRTPAVLMRGGSGTGKTIAGHVLTLDWMKRRDVDGFYLEAPTVAKIFQRAAAAETEDRKKEAFARILRAEDEAEESEHIFFLDDIGREHLTNAVADKIRELVRSLHSRRALAVFATNLTAAEIQSTYGEDVLSRLKTKSWLTEVNVFGPDERMRGWRGN